MKKKILLINPWIYDFAAYDLWAKPLGLLYIAAILRQYDVLDVHFIDTIDRYYPGLKVKNKFDSTGKYHTEEVEKPECIKWMDSRYKRYGIPLDLFNERLNEIGNIDACLITSRMTYWYPGVHKAVELVRNKFGNVPIIIGGAYPSLCAGHAKKHSGADYIVQGEGEEAVIPLLNDILNLNLEPSFDLKDLDSLPYPAFDLCYNFDHLAIAASRGCPNQCTYCASKIIHKKYRFRQRDPEKAASEIIHHRKKFGTKDFAFYDDALLTKAKKHFEPILDHIIASDIQCRFHTPNAMYAPAITASIAQKMFRTGFKNLRLSLETTNVKRIKAMGRDVFSEQLQQSVAFLKEAGFEKENLGVYIMIGLPGQDEEEVIKSVEFVLKSGVTPHLTEYSPLPNTDEWEKAITNSSMDIRNEPLLHNNTTYHYISQSLSQKSREKIKKIIHEW